MRVISSVSEMRSHAASVKAEGRSVALVPTMGALHLGHLSLLEIARQSADVVLASIFVNPSQFGPGEDYARYPRDLDGDLHKLAQAGVHAVFAPTVDDMYPDGAESHQVHVVPGMLTRHLCGPYRPGHFEGVATVVAMLFNICLPDVAVFGRKDAQQYVILRRMVRDLNFGIEIVGGETVREPDGLALSSRNSYLTQAERQQATVLYDAITEAEKLLRRGEQDPSGVVHAMTERVAKSSIATLQYAELVDSESLQPVGHLETGTEVIAALAVHFGKTRLIDNVFVRVA
ncbi:MAG: pantoate--beta-alanine ligase [Rhodothermales bacterium]|nr:pantoate--beta-alanine ligase [Rhodothermales bacterium]